MTRAHVSSIRSLLKPRSILQSLSAPLAVAFGVLMLSVPAAFSQEDGAVDIDQIRRELAQLKLGESNGAPATKEARRDFAVSALPREDAKLRTAEQDLLEELHRASAPATPEAVADATVAPVSLATRETEPLPMTERGRLDLDKIRERAVRKADLQRSSDEAVTTSAIIKKDEARTEPAPASSPAEDPGVFAGILGDEYVEAFKESPTTIEHPSRTAPTKVAMVDDRESKKAKSQIVSLTSKLATSERARTSLARELQEARNRLLIAETEVERLSSLMERRGAPSSRAVAAAPREQVATPRREVVPARTTVYSPLPRNDENMLVATVAVDKANLRAGPSLNDSPLMSISKGARLVVETRKGEWYRVIAPTGTRAWISAETVAFGRDGVSSPSRTVNVKAYDEEVDRDGFTRTKSE